MFKAKWIPPEETYPMWERVVESVRDRFETESYGFTIKHAELKELMGIEQAQTIGEVKKEQLDYMTGMDKARDMLLEDYNLFLYSVPGQGYQVLPPAEQIRKGADYYIRKSQKALARTASTLANVDSDMLDAESRNLQLLKMNRMAFIKAAFRKRRIPMPENNKMIA